MAMGAVRARLRHLLASLHQTGAEGAIRAATVPSLLRRLSSSAAQGSESADQARSYEAGDRSGGRSSADDAASVQSEPWTYYFQEIPPDDTASRLSQATKENMWQLHQQDSKHWTVDRLAEEYRVRRQRVHAILFLKDLEQRMEEKNGGPLDDEIEKGFDESHGTVDRAVGERHISMYPSEHVEKLEGDERMKALLAESAVEEEGKLKEFVMRLEFNKKLVPGGPVLANSMHRRRPPEGWSYMVEELGEEGRRGVQGGRRFVVAPDGSQRTLTPLEKMFVEREKTLPRRRSMPR